MEQTRILPGDVLVAKGAVKCNATLPEVGIKDVVPTGSWLEQKQVQAAIEARKQFLEIERIEKSGAISHAEWREDLMLAEVTQKVGSYWQYLGHNVGKKLFLYPEEALFLMEVNCLLLKYNNVKVSLQQAYALLLQGDISKKQYKVYASLSRLGYRIYRHEYRPSSESTGHQKKTDPTVNESIDEQDSVSEHKSVNLKSGETSSEGDVTSKSVTHIQKSKSYKYIQQKLLKLKSRKIKIMSSLKFHQYFNDIANCIDNQIITLKSPKPQYIPGNINVNSSLYILNLEKIRSSSPDPQISNPTAQMSNTVTSYRAPNITHGPNLSPFRNYIPNPNTLNFNHFLHQFNLRFVQPFNQFRHFYFHTQQRPFNYLHFNRMHCQRPHPFPYFRPRDAPVAFPRPNYNLEGEINRNYENNLARKKRTHLNAKTEHFESIQRLAVIVKRKIMNSAITDRTIFHLRHIIQTYNTRYRTRVRLTDDFNIIVDENIVATIELDDDDECKRKRMKTDDSPEGFEDKLNRVKAFASRLKELEMNNEAASRHRRTFSNLLRIFNKCYKVDYYLNGNYQILNRNQVVLDSSSHSEMETQDTKAKSPGKNKKLKNPFFILKQLSDKRSEQVSGPSTSKVIDIISDNEEINEGFKYSEVISQTFKGGWLPSVNDFGRAEIPKTYCTREVLDIQREEFLFDYMKIQQDKFKNWLDIKISFLECLRETSELFHSPAQTSYGLKSIVKPGDSIDTASVLSKLSIIKYNEKSNSDLNLAIDFDVYTRDTPNFKKTNRPLPHFRVICVSETSSHMPKGSDVLSLHSKYNDNVTIVFAVVGTGSISYLQINPVDLPAYMSTNNVL